MLQGVFRIGKNIPKAPDFAHKNVAEPHFVCFPQVPVKSLKRFRIEIVSDSVFNANATSGRTEEPSFDPLKGAAWNLRAGRDFTHEGYWLGLGLCRYFDEQSTSYLSTGAKHFTFSGES